MRWLVLVLLYMVTVTQDLLAEDLLIVTENFPPFQVIENGQVAGDATALVEQVLAQASIEARIEIRPWANSYNMATNRKNTLIYSMVRFPAREPLFEWLGQVGTMRVGLFKQSSREDIQVNSYTELNNYSVLTFIDSAPAHLLAEKGVTSVSEVPNTDSLARMLFRQRADLVAMSEHTFYASVLRDGHSIEDVTLVMVFESLSKGLWLAAHPETDPDMLVAIRHAFSTITSPLPKTAMPPVPCQNNHVDPAC